MKPDTLVLMNQMTQAIAESGKAPILDRLRIIAPYDDDISEQERRLDLIFVHQNIEFPDSNEELMQMYADWIDKNWG